MTTFTIHGLILRLFTTHLKKKKKILALGVGEYTFNPRTQQIEAGRSL